MHMIYSLSEIILPSYAYIHINVMKQKSNLVIYDCPSNYISALHDSNISGFVKSYVHYSYSLSFTNSNNYWTSLSINCVAS